MENKNFNWSGHINTLGDFPDMKMLWEKQFVSAVLDRIPKWEIKKVLEVGCSNGRWLRWFKKEYNCELAGLDNNPEGFINGTIDFKLGDCRKLPFEDRSFDLVFSLGLVEHFTKKDKKIIIKEQVRVLKQGGFLICSAPLLSLSLSFFYVKLNYDLRKGYKHFITTKKELEKYLRQNGIEVIFSETTGNIFESLLGIGKFNDLLKNKLLSKILATEILIIGRKI